MWDTYVRIADLDIKFVTKYSVRHICQDYMIKPIDNPDIVVTVSEEEIYKEMMAVDESERLYPAYYETVCLYRNLCQQIWKYNGLIFHAATFKVDNRAIAFAAKSGTGKSTHLSLWQQLLGNRLTVINGDKPIIRFIDNKPMAFGTPWNGKEGFGENTSAILTDICFIERSVDNYVSKLSKSDVLNKIFNQTLLPNDALGRAITLSLIDQLLEKCNIWCIKCNMQPQAAEVAYNAIINN